MLLEVLVALSLLGIVLAGGSKALREISEQSTRIREQEERELLLLVEHLRHGGGDCSRESVGSLELSDCKREHSGVATLVIRIGNGGRAEQ